MAGQCIELLSTKQAGKKFSGGQVGRQCQMMCSLLVGVLHMCVGLFCPNNEFIWYVNAYVSLHTYIFNRY